MSKFEKYNDLHVHGLITTLGIDFIDIVLSLWESGQLGVGSHLPFYALSPSYHDAHPLSRPRRHSRDIGGNMWSAVCALDVVQLVVVSHLDSLVDCLRPRGHIFSHKCLWVEQYREEDDGLVCDDTTSDFHEGAEINVSLHLALLLHWTRACA